MKTFIRLTAFILMLSMAFSSCKKSENEPINESIYLENSPAVKASTDECAGIHWTYEGLEGPEAWASLCPGWSSCNGTSQSPINIKNPVDEDDITSIKYTYNSTLTKIENNGHTVVFNCDLGSSILANGKRYFLKQFHYHALSEHQVASKHYPLEVHYVHEAADKSLAVVGVFFIAGASNPLFQKFLAKFPKTVGKYNSNDIIKLATLLPPTADYYMYKGSLTTPPCSEIVSWYVMKKPYTASSQQITDFAKILHNNYRPVQPLNGRVIYSYTK